MLGISTHLIESPFLTFYPNVAYIGHCNICVRCMGQTTMGWNRLLIFRIAHCHTANFDKNVFQVTASSMFNNIDLCVTQAMGHKNQFKSQYLML